MPRWSDVDEDWGDDDEPEEDDAFASSAEDGEPTVPCPHCRRSIPEDAPRCPYCENYVSREDAPPGRKPWWILIGVAAALYVMYRWVFNG